MEKMHAGRDSGHPMRKRRFRFTFYSVAVLIVILIAALRPWNGGEGFLFDQNSPITLYVKTEAGQMPEVDAAGYFPEAELNAAKFSFDWTGCDPDIPGTYTVPVFYDGKKTVCLLSVQVLPVKTLPAETFPGEEGSDDRETYGKDGETGLRNMTGGESTEER